MASGIKTFRLSNFGGGINSVSEANALSTFGQGVLCEAEDIENWTPWNMGGQRKTKGFTLFKDTGSATKITGLYEYIKANGDTYFLLTQGATLYKLVAGTLTSLSASLSSGPYAHFETARNTCIICDGVAIPRTFDGFTVTAMTTEAGATGAKQTLFYANRLWLFGNTNNPSLLYYSNPDVINAGYDSNFINCDFNDGQKITSIAKFFIAGQLEPVLVVGKTRSVGIIRGDGTTANPFTFIKINQDAGIQGFRQIVQFGQDIAYLTNKGVTSYQTDNQNVNLPFKFLSGKVQNKFQDLNTDYLKDSIAWYDYKNSRISFAVPESGKETPNVLWHYDIRLGGWYKERWGATQDCTACYIDSNGLLYHGDSNGKIYTHGDDDQNFDSTAPIAFYKTPYFDFGAPHLYKRIIAARAIVRGGGVYSLGVGAKLDWGIRNGKTNTLNVNASVGVWGTGTWGTGTWGASPIERKKFYPSGWFQSIQFNLTNSTSNQAIEIFELQFDVEFSNHI